MDGWKATATVQFDAKAPCTDFSLAVLHGGWACEV